MATPRSGKKSTDHRARFAQVRVLVADRDMRTAGLVKRVLMSFGFMKIETATSGAAVLDKLQHEKLDLIITELDMQPTDGLSLVRAIRRAKDEERFRRDLPIIMLTANAEKESVEAARDAGITEFLVKPFSANTISNRLIQVIDNPRSFVEASDYAGPCRRRRGAPPPEGERRGKRDGDASMRAPHFAIRDTMGKPVVPAGDILTPEVINEAQGTLLKAEGEFLSWAKDDIGQLEAAYGDLARKPDDTSAHQRLLGAAYAIKSQAGIFGYALGTEVAGMLVDYLTTHVPLDATKLTVARKHIDTITVIFREQIKEAGQAIGRELVDSLQKLITKIG